MGLVYAGLFVAMHPALWLDGRFLGWDSVREHWGDRVFPAQALADLQLPLWNPYEKGGYDFLADPQTGVLYPLNWLAWLLTLPFGDGPFIVLFCALLHVALAATGMHRLLEREGLAPWVRAFGGTALMLCARFAKSKDSAALWPAVWIPWLYLALKDALERPSWRTGGKLGFITAMALLAGHPPTAVRIVLTLVPLAILLLVQGYRNAPSVAGWARSQALALSAAVVTVVALCLPMLLAASQWMPLSVRQGMGDAEVLRSSISGWEAIHLFAPHLLQASDLSMQFVGVSVFGFALFRVFESIGGAEDRVLAGTAILFFVLSCGGNTPVLRFLVKYVPTFNLWRISEGYLFGVSFVIVLLACRGLSSLAARRDVPGDGLSRLQVGLTLALMWSAWAIAAAYADGWRLVVTTGAFLLLATATAGLFLIRRLPLNACIGVVFLGLLVDASVQNRTVYQISQPAPNLKKDGVLLGLKGVRDDWRVADDEHFQFRPGTRLGVRDLFGRYSTFVSRRYDGYQKRAKDSVPLLRAANVKHLAGPAVAKLRKTQPGKDALVPSKIPGLAEVKGSAARVTWHGKATLVPNEKASLDAVARGQSPVLERDRMEPALQARLSRPQGTQKSVAGQVTRFERNEFDFRILAPGPGVVSVAEAWAPGWQATVDGAPTAVFPVDHLFRGVHVEAGEHLVEMRYAPRLVRAAFIPWALAWIVLVLVALRRRSVTSEALP